MSKATAATLSAKEMQLLAAAWLSCPAQPKPDYAKVAEICGYKNAGVASVMFGQLKRKLKAAAGDGDADTTSDTPKSAKKRAATNADDSGTPKKTTRKSASAKKAAVVNEDNADGGSGIKHEDDLDFNDLLRDEDF